MRYTKEEYHDFVEMCHKAPVWLLQDMAIRVEDERLLELGETFTVADAVAAGFNRTVLHTRCKHDFVALGYIDHFGQIVMECSDELLEIGIIGMKAKVGDFYDDDDGFKCIEIELVDDEDDKKVSKVYNEGGK